MGKRGAEEAGTQNYLKHQRWKDILSEGANRGDPKRGQKGGIEGAAIQCLRKYGLTSEENNAVVGRPITYYYVY